MQLKRDSALVSPRLSYEMKEVYFQEDGEHEREIFLIRSRTYRGSSIGLSREKDLRLLVEIHRRAINSLAELVQYGWLFGAIEFTTLPTSLRGEYSANEEAEGNDAIRLDRPAFHLSAIKGDIILFYFFSIFFLSFFLFFFLFLSSSSSSGWPFKR